MTSEEKANGLTLEKLKLAAKVESLEEASKKSVESVDNLSTSVYDLSNKISTLTVVTKVASEDIKRVVKQSDAHNREIYGYNGNEGLKTRVTVLDNAEKDRRKHFLVFYGSIITAVVANWRQWVGRLFDG